MTSVTGKSTKSSRFRRLDEGNDGRRGMCPGSTGIGAYAPDILRPTSLKSE